MSVSVVHVLTEGRVLMVLTNTFANAILRVPVQPAPEVSANDIEMSKIVVRLTLPASGSI